MINSAIDSSGAGYNKEYIWLKAAAARVKGAVVRIGSTSAGLVDVSLADNTDVYKVAVAHQDIASGDYGLYQTKGRCTITTPSITTVAGDGVDILDGAVRASTTTAEKPTGVSTLNDFGVVLTAATSSTSHDVYLYGDAITAQT